MFRHKLFNMALIIMIAITLLSIVTFLLWKNYFQVPVNQQAEGAKAPSIDQVLALTVDTEEITTDLYTGDIIRIQFKLQVSNEKAKAELEKRLFQVNYTIISILSSLTPDDIKGEEGLNALEAMIMNRINEVMQEGKIVKVYTTKKILQ
ncbi:flagellar basal body-associated protein FliL [Microaerobacter geothermalis]|uniref:flagellar basal body-associated protein FliL n=1 Tax=Microaerobacter geothermalis TaxID=674972 RepID=UPI001F1B2729|nr:flagellar basal body-associated protein FliL [Microaerobacter geothermalis]MCF6093829.1 flagellar basal body-associated protein FliL [Microaerobacter geothermalis]